MKSSKGKGKGKKKESPNKESQGDKIDLMQMIFERQPDNSNLKSLVMDNYQLDHQGCEFKSSTQFLNLYNNAKTCIVTAYFNCFDYFSIVVERGLSFILDRFKAQLSDLLEKYGDNNKFKYYYFRCITGFNVNNDINSNLNKTLVPVELEKYPNNLSTEIEAIVNSIEDYDNTMLRNNITKHFTSFREYYKLLINYSTNYMKLPLFTEDFSEMKKTYLENIMQFATECHLTIRQFSYLNYFIVVEIPKSEISDK